MFPISEPSVFGERLRDSRKKRGLSQAELAGKTGLNKSVISHFETGERQYPSTHNLRKIAEALNVKSDYLIGIVDEQDVISGELTKLFSDFVHKASDDEIRTVKTLMREILKQY